MPQTLMAMLALIMTAMFVMDQEQGAARSRLEMVRAEVAILSTNVAVDALDRIGATAFDEATVGGRRAASASNLTAPGQFGDFDSPHNDIDDFHGKRFRAYRTIGADTLWFQVESRVSYADEMNPAREVTTPTRYKKASVTVYSQGVARTDTVRIWQSIACGSRCAW